jgi:hypothetical protein
MTTRRIASATSTMENRNDGKRGCGFELSATATGLEDVGKRESLGLCVGLIIKHAAFLSLKLGHASRASGCRKFAGFGVRYLYPLMNLALNSI